MLFLLLGLSVAQASECRQLCDEDFWKSATPEAVKAVLAGGADVNARTKDGWTPLHFAAGVSKTPAVVTALLKGGADVNARLESGETPLQVVAVPSETPSIVTALLEAGADQTAKAEDGQTPFDLIQKNDKLKGTEVYWRLNDAHHNKWPLYSL